jgi:hypothetical protein
VEGKDLTFPKVLGVVAAIVVIGNGLLLAAFLSLEIETQIYALVTRDERNVVSFLHQADKDRAKWSSPPPEIAPPRDHPPLEIVVGKSTYSIHYTTEEWLLANDCSAVTFQAKQQIWMSLGQSSPRTVLMHELLHVAKVAGSEAGFDKYYGDVNPFEYEDHDFINPSAPELLLILRRNPKLTDWLMDAQHTDSWE